MSALSRSQVRKRSIGSDFGPAPRTSPSGRRTRRRGRRDLPCGASRTRSASGRRLRAPSRSRASPRGRPRARRCRRRRRLRSRRPAARSATCSVAYSRCVGVEYAHWLLSQMKTTGSLRMPAKFIPSCASPRADRAFAEPGDRDALLLADAERERAADGDGKHRRQVADHRDQPEVASRPCGRCRPLPCVGPSTRPMYWAKIRHGSTPRVMWTPMSRCSGVPTSSGPSPSRRRPRSLRCRGPCRTSRESSPAGRGCDRAPRRRA